VRPKVGFLTIGQSPRVDVVSDIAGILGPEIDILDKGALDGLSQKEICRLRPEKNDFPLITRLRDGSAVVVGKKKIIPLLQRQISALEKEHVQLIALLCTDDFPELKSQKLLLRPSQILFGAVTSIIKKGTLAVLAPLTEQKAAIKKKWQRTGLQIIVEDMNPYQKPSDAKRVIRRIKNKNVNLIILDCIGYSSKTKEKIGRATGKPVLLARSILARMIKELI